jgi:hypothetical protein
MPEVQEQEEFDKSKVDNSINEAMIQQMNQMMTEMENLKRQVTQPVTAEQDNYKNLIRDLGKVINKDSDSKPVSNFQGFSEISDTDPDDILSPEEICTFISHKVLYVIVDGFVNNKPVKVPYKPIVFKFQGAKKTGSGRDTNIFNFSTYVCKSRKELNFLKTHHLFGVMFFDNINKSKSIDTEYAIKLASAMKALQTVEAGRLIPMCKELGIDITSDADVHQMRAQIAIKTAAQYENSAKLKAEEMLRETEANKLFAPNL